MNGPTAARKRDIKVQERGNARQLRTKNTAVVPQLVPVTRLFEVKIGIDRVQAPESCTGDVRAITPETKEDSRKEQAQERGQEPCARCHTWRTARRNKRREGDKSAAHRRVNHWFEKQLRHTDGRSRGTLCTTWVRRSTENKREKMRKKREKKEEEGKEEKRREKGGGGKKEEGSLQGEFPMRRVAPCH